MNRSKFMLASLLVAMAFSIFPLTINAEDSQLTKDYDQAITDIKKELQELRSEVDKLNKKLEQRKEDAERKKAARDKRTHPATQTKPE
jgi:peptidoglycan hydrolase CwlO-like protein